MPADEKSNSSIEQGARQSWDQPLDDDLLFVTLKRLEADPFWEQRQSAIAWLRDRAGEIAQDDGLRNTTLNALCRMDNMEDQDRNQIIRMIWVNAWAEKQPAILDYVLGVLNQEEDSDHRVARRAAVDFLMEKADDFTQDNRSIHRSLSALSIRIKVDRDDLVRNSAIEAMRELLEVAWLRQPQTVIHQIDAALRSGDWAVRKTAASWLKERSSDVAEDDGMARQIHEALLEMVGTNVEQDAEVSRTAQEALLQLWGAGWKINANREVLQGYVIEHVLTALQQCKDLKIRQAAVDWLGDKAFEIAKRKNDYRSYKQAADLLVGQKEQAIADLATWDDGLEPSKENSELKQYLSRVDTSLKRLWEALNQEQFPRQKAILLDPDEPQNRKIIAIWQLSDKNTLGSMGAMRFLVDEWVRWIAEGRETHLVELTAEAIRSNHYAVLTLIQHFGSAGRLQPSAWFGSNLSGKGEQPRLPVEMDIQHEGVSDHPASSHAVKSLQVDHFRKHVNNWIKKGRESEGLLEAGELGEAEAVLAANRGKRVNFRKDLEHLIAASRKSINATRMLWVDLRIAKQLADMSDPTFFEDAEDEVEDRRKKQDYKLILKELKKRAVPLMLRRISEAEENTGRLTDNQKIKNEIREHIVRMLGFTGGREAVDALARRVVGMEKERKDRQDLLDEYYLKPSLRRGEEAADILNGTVVESKRTLFILQSLNTLIFLIGLALLGIGLYFTIRGGSGASRAIGAVSAVGGFSGMIILLVKAPLEQIQNAMAKLVHVETAFTSFIWQLNLNGTFIQSRYVRNGKLADSEIEFTVDRIERAMETTMNLVSTHTEDDTPRLVTRLTSLEPAGGEAGREVTVTIHGQNLLGDSTQKKDREGMVAINHVPVNVSAARWTERAVSFGFPVEMMVEDGSETAWISLFVDGIETNALPFRVIRKSE